MSKAAVETKVLEKRIKEKSVELEAQLARVKQAQRALAVMQSDLSQLQERLESMSSEGEIVITNHAVLRYIERVEGISPDELKKKILPQDDRIIDAIMTLGGSGTFPVGNTHSVVLKNWHVVTVLDHSM